MKKFLLFFAVVATMLAACTKDATKDLAIDRPIDKFYVTVGEDDSRVQLNEACQTVWTANDKVSVFYKTTGNRLYRFRGQTGDKTGELYYMSGAKNGDAIDRIIAVYPYGSTNEVTTEGVISTTIPATQTYCKDSYGVGSSIMVARSDDEKLWFRNVMGWIRLSLTGNQIVKTITLKGCNNEPLAGKATIADDLSVTFTDYATDALTLDCGKGVQLTAEPTDFYIAVAPQTFGNGFYAEAVDADNNIILLKTVKSVTVQRNHIASMAQSELPLPTGLFHNQIWYTTSDGNTITPESYQGYILSNTYTAGKGVITFDCAQTEIGEKAFCGCTGLTSVTIPDSVTTIGYAAFYDCTSLTSVTIPDSVTSIGNYAFRGCTGLTNVTIPDSVTEIGSAAFAVCTGLTSVTIPDSVTSIGSYAFYGCTGLKSVIIPDSVTEIGEYTFYQCTGLTSVTIGNSVTGIGGYAFEGCTGLTSVTIGNGVTSIGSDAFNNCTGLKSVTIPDSVTSIGYSAFYDCTSLTSVTIPDSVTSIGKYAFYNCTGELYINCNIQYSSAKSESPFYGSKFTKVTIGDSVTKIGSYAFYDCTGLTSVTIGNSVTSIGSYAFYGCTGLTSVTIPDSVTSIGSYAFNQCTGLTSVTIPDSVTSIGSYAFYGCTGLTSVTIPDSVTSIGSYAFYGCTGLTSVTIPDSVTGIGGYAFEGCTGLTSVTIGNGVTSIGSDAFNNCTGLTGVYITDIAAWCKITFGNGYANPLYYAKKLYLNGELVTDLVIPDSVTSIGNYAFYGCKRLKSVTIPDSVITIGSSAFRYCTSLTGVYITDIAAWCKIIFGNYYANPLSYAGNLYLDGQLVTDLVIPDSVTSISWGAFYGCTGMTSITIPDSVTRIGDYAFYGCTGLKSVTIGNSVTSIGKAAFYDCKGLTKVYITDLTAWCKIKFYDEDANPLYYAKKLYLNEELVTDLVIPDGTTKIGSHVFFAYASLTSVTIPDSVTSIGSYAFRYCTGLTSVTIGNSVTSIGSSAFEGCKGLTSIYCKPTTPPTLGSYAFDYVASSAKIYVPSASVEAYQTATNWSSYSSIIVGYNY